MSIRCKMRVEGVYAQQWGGAKVIFRSEYDQKIAEDVSFAKATPTALFEAQIDNPKAAEQIVIGKTYYFDITAAE
ncbi:MAG TPA: hypothetical protein PLI96_07930 [Halothiobacillus sp.]|nr:hypothetical protein [Halothiobacillus sp.]